jgi:hypothetical protein
LHPRSAGAGIRCCLLQSASIPALVLLRFPLCLGPGSAPSSCAPGCSSTFLFRRASVSGSCSHPSTPAQIALVSVFTRTTEHPGLIHRGEDSSTPSPSAFGYLENSFWSSKRTQFWCDILCRSLQEHVPVSILESPDQKTRDFLVRIVFSR